MKAIPTFFLTSLCLLAFAATPSAEAAQPNVLFLIVDDLNCRIGCYGDPIAKTPNIDRLASEGVRFDRAYCNFPVCNASRSSVMSGRYPTTTGVVGNTTWLILEDGHPTLNQHFEQQGYSAALIGKIYHAQNTGFADASDTPEVKGRLTWATPAERARQQAANPAFWKSNFDHYRTDPPPEDEIKRLTEWHNAMFSAVKFPVILGFAKSQQKQFLMDLFVKTSYATVSVSSMIAMSTIQCERQVRIREHFS